jgi:hypothetical protein
MGFFHLVGVMIEHTRFEVDVAVLKASGMFQDGN